MTVVVGLPVCGRGAPLVLRSRQGACVFWHEYVPPLSDGNNVNRPHWALGVDVPVASEAVVSTAKDSGSTDLDDTVCPPVLDQGNRWDGLWVEVVNRGQTAMVMQ